jgi:hypothetical protein
MWVNKLIKQINISELETNRYNSIKKMIQFYFIEFLK